MRDDDLDDDYEWQDDDEGEYIGDAAEPSGPPYYGPTAKQLRAINDAALWENARADYLDGDTAEVVCDRYDLAVSTLKHKAAKQGWRRADQPLPPPRAEPPADDSPVDVPTLADDVLARVRDAVARGRPGEAGSWMRLHEKLSRLAATDDAPAGPDRLDAVVAMARSVDAVARCAADMDLNDADNRGRVEAQIGLLHEAMDALRSPVVREQRSTLDPSDPVFSGPPADPLEIDPP